MRHVCHETAHTALDSRSSRFGGIALCEGLFDPAEHDVEGRPSRPTLVFAPSPGARWARAPPRAIASAVVSTDRKGPRPRRTSHHPRSRAARRAAPVTRQLHHEEPVECRRRRNPRGAPHHELSAGGQGPILRARRGPHAVRHRARSRVVAVKYTAGTPRSAASAVRPVIVAGRTGAPAFGDPSWGWTDRHSTAFDALRTSRTDPRGQLGDDVDGQAAQRRCTARRWRWKSRSTRSTRPARPAETRRRGLVRRCRPLGRYARRVREAPVRAFGRGTPQSVLDGEERLVDPFEVQERPELLVGGDVGDDEGDQAPPGPPPPAGRARSDASWASGSRRVYPTSRMVWIRGGPWRSSFRRR